MARHIECTEMATVLTPGCSAAIGTSKLTSDPSAVVVRGAAVA